MNDHELRETKMGLPPPYTAGPPPPGPPGGSPEPTTVIVNDGPQTNVPAASPAVVPQPIGPKASNIICPSCNIEIVTRVEYLSTTKTHLWAALFCIIGGLFLVWIPYCGGTCRNSSHYCPNCNSYIGTYVK